MAEAWRRARDDAAAALVFLTRIPVPWYVPAIEQRLHRASVWFPVVGIVVGGIGATVAWLATAAFGPLIAALLAVTVTAAVTGAFHEDGLADTFDAAGAGDRASALAIMRDSRMGTFGGLALGLVTALRVAALAALGPAAPAALVGAHTLARYAALPLIRWLAYARADGGAAKPFAGGIGGAALAIATAVTAAVTLALWQATALAVWAVAALIVAAGAGWARRRLGGITGDVLGAANQLVETAAYLVLVAAVA